MASVSPSNISKEEFSRACDSYVIKLNTPTPPPPKPIKLTPIFKLSPLGLIINR